MTIIAAITDKNITGSHALAQTPPRHAVGVVLIDKDMNMATCYGADWDMYTLPGGGVDDGECFITAVKREMLEETGCACEIIGEIGLIIENRAEHDFTQQKYHYLATVVGEKGMLHLTEKEISAGQSICWLPPKEVLKIYTEQQPKTYQQQFIKARDIAVLTKAVAMMENQNNYR